MTRAADTGDAFHVDGGLHDPVTTTRTTV